MPVNLVWFRRALTSERHETFEVAYRLAVGRSAVLPLLAVLGVVIQLLTKKEAELKKSTPASRAEPEFLTSRTHPVGQKQCNGFGLYDMHGNVWEWCWDGFAVDYYQQSPTDDPRGPRQAELRVIRGGSCGYDPRAARSAARACRFPEHHIEDLGFRVVRGPSGR